MQAPVFIFPRSQIALHLMGLYLFALCNAVIGLGSVLVCRGEFWAVSDDSLH